MQQSEPRVSLRVGPFEAPADMVQLCEKIQAQGLSCGMIQDLGSSSRVNSGNRQRATSSGYYQSQSRESDPLPRGEEVSNMQSWVLLGTYRSRQEAMDIYSTFRDAHNERNACILCF